MGPTVALSFPPTLTSCDNYWELVPMARPGRGSLVVVGGGAVAFASASLLCPAKFTYEPNSGATGHFLSELVTVRGRQTCSTNE